MTLEDALKWAAKQPARNFTTVQFAMTINDPARTCRVLYAGGILAYEPGGSKSGPSFSISDVHEYFSDRTYACDSKPGNLGPSSPFNCANTEPITIVISSGESSPLPPYSVSVQSAKWGTSSFIPQTDPTTGVMTGVLGSAFVTVSLCNPQSVGSPK